MNRMNILNPNFPSRSEKVFYVDVLNIQSSSVYDGAHSDRDIRLIIKNCFDAIPINRCTKLKNELSGILNISMVVFAVHTLFGLSALHVELGTHLRNIAFFDKAAWAQTLPEEFDAHQKDSKQL